MENGSCSLKRWRLLVFAEEGDFDQKDCFSVGDGCRTVRRPLEELKNVHTGRYSPMSLTAGGMLASIDLVGRGSVSHTTQFELVGFYSFFLDAQC